MSEQINPGDGWRLLGPDEVTQQGDETWIRHKRTWEPLTMFFCKKASRFSAIRRRIPAKPEPDGVLFYEWRVENGKAVIRIDMEMADNAKQARQLADWLTRYAEWREAQDAAK